MTDDVFISKKAFMGKLDQKQGVPGSTIRFTEGYNDAILRVRSMLLYPVLSELARGL